MEVQVKSFLLKSLLLSSLVAPTLLIASFTWAQMDTGPKDTLGAWSDASKDATANGHLEDWNKLMETKELDKTSARASFYALFKSAQADLMADKLPKAKKNMERLHAMENKNTYEQARIYLLDYWYAGKTGDKQQETQAMEALVPIAAGNIDSNAFVEAGMRLFKRQYNNKDYGGAIDTLGHLRKDPNSLAELNNFVVLVGKLDEMTTSNQNISHTVKTDETGVWGTSLLRSSFMLDAIVGEVRNVDFTCENKKTSINYTPASAMSVPASWGKCVIKINSSPNTSYMLIQLINKPA